MCSYYTCRAVRAVEWQCTLEFCAKCAVQVSIGVSTMYSTWWSHRRDDIAMPSSFLPSFLPFSLPRSLPSSAYSRYRQSACWLTTIIITASELPWQLWGNKHSRTQGGKLGWEESNAMKELLQTRLRTCRKSMCVLLLLMLYDDGNNKWL